MNVTTALFWLIDAEKFHMSLWLCRRQLIHLKDKEIFQQKSLIVDRQQPMMAIKVLKTTINVDDKREFKRQLKATDFSTPASFV